MALSPTPDSPIYLRDKDHAWQMVSILVEGILFEIPIHRLSFYSNYFSLEYSITAASKAQKDYPPGDPRWAPVVLDVSIEDFRGFLKALYPKYHPICTSNGRPFLRKDEWLSVLKLSTLWFFNHFRKMSIESLTPELDTLEKILLGTEYHVSAWVVEGYRELIVRPAHPTYEEGRRIGFRTIMTLWGIRDSHKAFGFPAVRTADNVIEEKIYEAFRSQLEDLGNLEYEHLTPYDRQRADAAKVQRERVVKEARMKEEEREAERRLRKRRRKERSSVGSKQDQEEGEQEEDLAFIHPSAPFLLAARPGPPPPHIRREEEVLAPRSASVRRDDDHRCLPERPCHPPPPMDPDETNVFQLASPSRTCDEDTSSPPSSPISLRHTPPSTPPRPKVQATSPQPPTPFFTPASAPPPLVNASHAGNDDDEELEESKPLVSESLEREPVQVWPFCISLLSSLAKSKYAMTMKATAVLPSVTIESLKEWTAARYSSLRLQWVRTRSFVVDAWTRSPHHRSVRIVSLPFLLLLTFTFLFCFFFSFFFVRYPRFPDTLSFLSDEHFQLVFLRAVVVFACVLAFGGVLEGPCESRIVA